MPRHLRSLLDLDSDDVARVLDLAARVKADPATYRESLRGKSIAMIFAKQSTRTRISFEVGIHQLGAQALALATGGGTGMQMGRGETVADTAQVLSRYVHAVVIRTFAQEEIEGLAEHGSIPIVNALTDRFHPCQALADLLTIREKLGSTRGKKLVYVGAGNNVAHSLMLAGARAGMDVVVACPESLRPDQTVLERARADASAAGTRCAVEHDPRVAVKGAHVVYTDTWVSMGEEAEAKALKARLAGFMVDEALMDATGNADAIFMHCLPAHRDEEVSSGVMDGRWSVVFDQAENRLHAQKAVLLLLLEAEAWR
jgi:ornithine carbamoyltransferase